MAVTDIQINNKLIEEHRPLNINFDLFETAADDLIFFFSLTTANIQILF